MRKVIAVSCKELLSLTCREQVGTGKVIRNMSAIVTPRFSLPRASRACDMGNHAGVGDIDARGWRAAGQA